MHHGRMHADNARVKRDQTDQTRAANALRATISRHAQLAESYNCNILHINDQHFPNVVNKFNALIIRVKPPPRLQQVSMLPTLSSHCSEHIEPVELGAVFSVVPIVPDIACSSSAKEYVVPDVTCSPSPKEEYFDYSSWESEIW